MYNGCSGDEGARWQLYFALHLRTQACERFTPLFPSFHSLLLSSPQFPSVPYPLPGFTLKGDVALSAPLWILSVNSEQKWTGSVAVQLRKNYGLLFQRGRQDFSIGGKKKIQGDGSKARVLNITFGTSVFNTIFFYFCVPLLPMFLACILGFGIEWVREGESSRGKTVSSFLKLLFERGIKREGRLWNIYSANCTKI